MGCGRYRSWHAVDGAKDHAIKWGGQQLSTLRMDLCRDPEGADRFLKKGRLLALRLGEGNGDLWPAKGYGNSWKAGTRTEVEQRGDSGWQCAGAGKRFAITT